MACVKWRVFFALVFQGSTTSRVGSKTFLDKDCQGAFEDLGILQGVYSKGLILWPFSKALFPAWRKLSNDLKWDQVSNPLTGKARTSEKNRSHPRSPETATGPLRKKTRKNNWSVKKAIIAALQFSWRHWFFSPRTLDPFFKTFHIFGAQNLGTFLSYQH